MITESKSKTSKASAYPPGPKGYLSNLPAMLHDLPSFLMQMSGYGEIIRWQTGPLYWYLVANPDGIEQVLVKEASSFRKGRIQGLVANPVFRSGLVAAERDVWLRSRRLMQPAFHHKMLSGYGEIISQYAAQMVARWQPGEQLDLYQAMKELTLEIVADILLGTPGSASELGRLFDQVQSEVAHRMSLPLPVWLPTPSNRRLRRALKGVDAVTYRIMRERIAEQAAGSAKQNDLLSILLTIRDEYGRGVSTEQVRDEMVTMIIAGHETVAAALCRALYLIAQHPDVEAALQHELDDVLGGCIPAFADLPELRFTESTVREAMRLYPPAILVSREATQDVEIGGFLIKRGAQVIPSPWVTQRDSRYYKEPERFDPGRWTAEMKRALPKYAYFPFGGGPRICIGNQLALMEAQLVLATVASCFHLTLVDPNQHPHLMIAPSTRPYEQVMVQIETRQ